MSTAQTPGAVKQALRDALHAEILPGLDALVDSLPDSLLQAGQAERLLRAGLLAAARQLLQAWGKSADRTCDRPACAQCGLPMRHKGSKPGSSLTTVGRVRFRRPRWRCEPCGRESYPHDAAWRFLGHGVSWPLAEVISRLGAQLPFGQARDNLAADYGVRLAQQTVTDVTEAAGAEVLRAEDERRHRVAGRQEPLPPASRWRGRAGRASCRWPTSPGCWCCWPGRSATPTRGCVPSSPMAPTGCGSWRTITSPALSRSWTGKIGR